MPKNCYGDQTILFCIPNINIFDFLRRNITSGELKRYQEEIGKGFKRITLFLCTDHDLKKSEGHCESTDSSEEPVFEETSVPLPAEVPASSSSGDVVEWRPPPVKKRVRLKLPWISKWLQNYKSSMMLK